ncbi:hypothetical protein N431DRAFT_468387 [Stipitochalara longipes BDJ]|nr:hypothetical protein N431DRAFT_468387 [Stipitochalara longipes BDJ]
MGYQNPYYDYDPSDCSTTTPLNSAEKALRSFCIGRYSSSYTQLIESAIANGAITMGGISTWCASLHSTNGRIEWVQITDSVSKVLTTTFPHPPISTRCETFQYTHGAPDALPDYFSFQASSPCCNRCTITTGDIQVYHWPPSTSGPSFSTLINYNGFTFTYPSVYVAIETLQGYDLCGAVGTAVNSITTVGFDVTDLSTATSYLFPSEWQDDRLPYESWWTYSQIDFETSMSCTDITTTLYADDFDNIIPTPVLSLDSFNKSTNSFAPVLVTYNPCTPYLSVPTRILTLDSRWSTCVRYLKGLHDPPIIMNTENGFFPVTTASAPLIIPTKTNVPAAVPAIQQSLAIKTPSPAIQTTSGSRYGPPLASMFISKLPVVITMKDTTITYSESGFVFDSQTLTPGGEITISESLLSMAPDGLVLIINKTSTQSLDLTYVAGTQTLSAGGPAVDVLGTLVSIQLGGESVVIEESTTEDISVLLRGPTPSVPGLGGPQDTPSPSIHGATFNSGSRKIECKGRTRWQVLLFIIVIFSPFR